MKVDGACHCGQVSFEAEVDPAKVIICHCTDCQTLSGTAFRTVVFTESGSFKLLSGEIKIYFKTGESGARRAQGFCPECGTPIYATSNEENPQVHALRVGAVNQRDELEPKRHVYARSRQSWTNDVSHMAVTEGSL
jgi:hypothetical protein